MHMSHDDYVATVRAKVAADAEALKTGDAPYLETIRSLNQLGHELTEDVHSDPDFVIFLAIDSETDHLPAGAIRSSCDAKWLAKCDEQIASVEACYRETVTKACEALITRFGAG
jgi:hypothetical protein